MKKRMYQIGITTGVGNKDINAILRARDRIIVLNGEEAWKRFYKDMCNKTREHFNIPYVLGLSPSIDNKEVIGITVFEHMANNECYYDVHWDEEKQMYYIEVESDEV